MTFSWIEAILAFVCAFLVVLPPRWDPAIRWRERRERERARREGRPWRS